MELDNDWNKYIKEYGLKTWIDHWGDGPTAKLYYTHPNESVVEDIRFKSDIPVISEKEAKILTDYNQLRRTEISKRLLDDDFPEFIPTVIFFEEIEFKKFRELK